MPAIRSHSRAATAQQLQARNRAHFSENPTNTRHGRRTSRNVRCTSTALPSHSLLTVGTAPALTNAESVAEVGGRQSFVKRRTKAYPRSRTASSYVTSLTSYSQAENAVCGPCSSASFSCCSSTPPPLTYAPHQRHEACQSAPLKSCFASQAALLTEDSGISLSPAAFVGASFLLSLPASLQRPDPLSRPNWEHPPHYYLLQTPRRNIEQSHKCRNADPLCYAQFGA